MSDEKTPDLTPPTTSGATPGATPGPTASGTPAPGPVAPPAALTPTTTPPPRTEVENIVETLGASTLFQLCAAIIELREKNDRQHKLFEQTLAKTREGLQAGFDNFAGATQKAYQNLRQDIVGEKRIALALFNEILELAQDLDQITRNRPSIDDREAVLRWMEAIAVENRKVQAALLRHGIHPYDAVIGAPYDPKLHERVGSKRVEGLGPLLIAEQRERGFASQQPEFVLRRPKVVVSE